MIQRPILLSIKSVHCQIPNAKVGALFLHKAQLENVALVTLEPVDLALRQLHVANARNGLNQRRQTQYVTARR